MSEGQGELILCMHLRGADKTACREQAPTCKRCLQVGGRLSFPVLASSNCMQADRS
jgi:hypothetical protein